MECGVVQVSRSGLSDLSLRWDARDLGHLVRTKNPDLPRLLSVNESPGGGDPNVLASSHADRVTANSVYGKRLPFSGSQKFPNSFHHTIWLLPKGNSDKDGAWAAIPLRGAIPNWCNTPNSRPQRFA